MLCVTVQIWEGPDAGWARVLPVRVGRIGSKRVPLGAAQRRAALPLRVAASARASNERVPRGRAVRRIRRALPRPSGYQRTHPPRTTWGALHTVLCEAVGAVFASYSYSTRRVVRPEMYSCNYFYRRRSRLNVLLHHSSTRTAYRRETYSDRNPYRRSAYYADFLRGWRIESRRSATDVEFGSNYLLMFLLILKINRGWG